MGTVTTTILIGFSHRLDGNIIPSHILMLQEGDHPSWNLLPIHTFSKENMAEPSFYWSPIHPKTIMKDGFLMLATYVLKDKAIQAILKKDLNLKSVEKKNLMEKLFKSEFDETRNKLYVALSQCDFSDHKIVISFINSSSLVSQLDEFKPLKWDIEILMPKRSDNYDPILLK